LKNPSNYTLLAESTRIATGKQFHLWYPQDSGYPAHFRHEKFMNIFFADGHASAVDKDGLRNAYRDGTCAGATENRKNQIFLYIWHHGGEITIKLMD
jgi:prepilin-type processing-associated H-X9-DG protein